VHGRQDRDRLLREVDAREDARRFRDARQAFGQRLGRQVVQVQVDVVLVRADAAAFADLDRHAARDHVAGGEVLVGRRVAFHEPLALGVGEVAAFAARALGDEAAGAVDAGGVELHEFHVLQRQALARDHAAAVAGAGVGGGGGEIGAAVAAGGQHDHLRAEDVERAVVELPRHDADAGPSSVIRRSVAKYSM
jgi:hypothetical protein